ncbi:hypothetical protein P886_3564 [Alteromonadaceae bacterium 2753L.S.0a.02]|nr:hypothetical protein P886_3564 [Alteromonadaceae bacterium 2753L.S.0a.02]
MSNEPKNIEKDSRNFVVRSVKGLGRRYRASIRAKAIERAKTRIYLHGKKPEEFEEDVLEIIVKEEEDKIKAELKDKTIIALLAALGISFWT